MKSQTQIKRQLYSCAWALALAGLLTCAQPLHAQDADSPKKELSDEVNEGIPKIAKLAEEEKLKEALDELNKLVAKAGPQSYDLAILSQFKVQILARLGRQSEIIEPLETALRLSKAHGYFPPKTEQDLYLFLAQQYQVDATTEKTLDAKKAKLNKAIGYLREWQTKAAASTADIQLVIGSVLYFRATLDDKNIDASLLKEALAELDKGLLLAIKPKDNFYLLKLGIVQILSGELQRMEKDARDAKKDQQAEKLKEESEALTKQSAEILELLVKAYPNKKDYWNSLYMTYIQMGMDVRAILALERAQSLGLLNSTKEYKTLAALYYNSDQYSHAVDILEPGLKNNTIDSTRENWELLIACYQQLYREDKLMSTLKEASTRFPDQGVFDQQIGYAYFGQEKLDKAYEYFTIALKKGGFNKPAPIYSFTAYLAFELKKLDEALVLIDEALKLDPSMKDARQMRESITASIKERDDVQNKINQVEPKKTV